MNQPKTTRIEVAMSFNEMKRSFPVGSERIIGGVRYEVVGDYKKAPLSTAFASYPSFLAKVVVE